MRIRFLLVPDVLPYHRFVQAHGRNEVATCPEILAREVLRPPRKLSRDRDRALSLDVPTTYDTECFDGMLMQMYT